MPSPRFLLPAGLFSVHLVEPMCQVFQYSHGLTGLAADLLFIACHPRGSCCSVCSDLLRYASHTTRHAFHLSLYDVAHGGWMPACDFPARSCKRGAALWPIGVLASLLFPSPSATCFHLLEVAELAELLLKETTAAVPVLVCFGSCWQAGPYRGRRVVFVLLAFYQRHRQHGIA